MVRITFVAVALCSLLIPVSALAAKRGEGAIVIEDETPIYRSAKRDEIAAVVDRGFTVSALSGNVILSPDYYFDEKNGRVRVNYFPDGTDRGKHQIGWIEPEKLAIFTYDCECGEEECSPVDVRGFKFSFTWTVCFKEGRDERLRELEKTWDAENVSRATGGTEPTEPARLIPGQTPGQVKEVLGEPDTTLEAGGKLIFLYPDLKITFVEGELSSIE